MEQGSSTDEIVELAGHLVVPIAFGRAQSRLTHPQQVLDALWTESRAAVVLTDGAGGSYVRQADDAVAWHVPACPVTAVDTTGAGDCFHGAYALALAEGQRPLDCVLFATAAAGMSVTAHGGRRGLPDREACLRWVAEPTMPKPVPLSRN